MRVFRIIALAILLGALVSACGAPTTNVHTVTANYDNISNFWNGADHGLSLPWNLIGYWSGAKVYPYDVNNNGGPYNFGFGLGAFPWVLLFAGVFERVRLFIRY